VTETIRFSYTIDDIDAALRAHYRAVRPSIAKTALVILLTAFGVAVFVGAVDDELTARHVAVTTARVALVLGILIAPLRWIGFRSVAAGAARNFALQQELQGEIQMGFDDSQMTWQTPYGQSHRPYAIIPFWYAHEGLVLIYQSETTYFLVPAAAFANAAQRDLLIAHLRGHGVKERGT
jgi:hypothetical protein